MERKGIVTVKGNPVTLIGSEIKVGDKAPDFTVVDGDLKEVRLKDFAGKIKIISVSASLDTPVCDMQARTVQSGGCNITGGCGDIEYYDGSSLCNLQVLHNCRHR